MNRTAALDGPSIAAGAYVGLGCSLVGTIAGVSGTNLLAGCGLGTVAAFVGTLYGAPSFLMSGTLAALISMQIGANRPREYEACEHGLEYAEIGSVGTQYLPWERVDGLRETDEAVVLERRWWINERIAADEVPPDAREAIRAAVDSPTTR